MKSHGHSHEEIKKRFSKPPKPSFLKDLIYGGIDGSVTTFAIVAGVVGANLSAKIILILGFANLLADGFSMGAANFLGTKSEEEEFLFLKDIEKKHIEKTPEGEEIEIREIYSKKGFRGKILESIVVHITSNKNLWVNTMLREEYGLSEQVKSPIFAGIATFIAFLICGFVPLIPFILSMKFSFYLSFVLTAITFFIIGSFKSKWSIYSWYRSGFSTLSVGLIAASLAYFIGYVSHLIVGT